MQVSVSGKQIDIGSNLRAYVEEKLANIVSKYLGPNVRLDDLYLKTVRDGLSSASESWHDDNVGYRLKLFMVFDTSIHCTH